MIPGRPAGAAREPGVPARVAPAWLWLGPLAISAAGPAYDVGTIYSIVRVVQHEAGIDAYDFEIRDGRTYSLLLNAVGNYFLARAGCAGLSHAPPLERAAGPIAGWARQAAGAAEGRYGRAARDIAPMAAELGRMDAGRVRGIESRTCGAPPAGGGGAAFRLEGDMRGLSEMALLAGACHGDGRLLCVGSKMDEVLVARAGIGAAGPRHASLYGMANQVLRDFAQAAVEMIGDVGWEGGFRACPSGIRPVPGPAVPGSWGQACRGDVPHILAGTWATYDCLSECLRDAGVRTA